MRAHIAVMPGDGIGPEVTREAVRVLEAVAEAHGHAFTFDEHPIGGVSIDARGAPISEHTITACRRSDAVLLGAVGGPEWRKAPVGPEHGLLELRAGLEAWANLRPVASHPSLDEARRIRLDEDEHVDLLIVRDLAGGCYDPTPSHLEGQTGPGEAVDTITYHRSQIEVIGTLAFEHARQREGYVASVTKHNVLDTSQLWRRTVAEVSETHPECELEHALVDAFALRLVEDPASVDVVATTNLFGDILSDVAASAAGSLGLLPSATLTQEGPGIFEPVHGSAPDIAGNGAANPIGAILSAAMLLEEAMSLPSCADRVRAGVDQALAAGVRTPDLGGTARTSDVGKRVARFVRRD